MKRFKLSEYTNEKIEVYKKAPEFWVGQLAKKKDKRFVDIFTGYMNTDETLKEVGKKHGVSPERVRQISVMGLSIIFRQSKMKRVQSLLDARGDLLGEDKKESLGKKPGNPQMNPLTQEEFDEIKEQLFRGESVSDIAQLVGRSIGVVGRVARNETLEAYFKNNYNNVLRRKRALLQVAEEAVSPKVSFERARIMQEKILDAVVEFVAGEVEEIGADNAQLRAENNALRKELEKKRPDFITMLGDRFAGRGHN